MKFQLAFLLMFVFGALILIKANNAQYFSTSDGATLSRIGKRNYLFKIIYLRRPSSHLHPNQENHRELDQKGNLNLDVDGQNSLSDDDLSAKNEIKLNDNINHHENLNQVDKLSHVRKLHNKFGKRFINDPEIGDDDQDDEADLFVDDSDEDFSNENLQINEKNQQKFKELIKNLMNEYKENLKRPFKNQLD
jgi:hypothetical protein